MSESDAKDDKRKLQGEDDDAVSESQQKKAREEAVTDEEVEEFYAILRRINTAVKYFKGYGDDVAALEKDIMQEVKKEATRNENETHVQQNFTLDLNVTPQTPT